MAEDTAPVTDDGAQNAADLLAQWTDLRSADTGTFVDVPGTNNTVQFADMQVDGNKVSIWTSSDSGLPPDFVVVNPPASADPLTAIAIAIDGASS